MPKLCSFSITEAAASFFVLVDSTGAKGCDALSRLDLTPFSVVLVRGAFVEGRRFEDELASGEVMPGCLKMPKFIDRLWD